MTAFSGAPSGRVAGGGWFLGLKPQAESYSPFGAWPFGPRKPRSKPNKPSSLGFVGGIARSGHGEPQSLFIPAVFTENIVLAVPSDFFNSPTPPLRISIPETSPYSVDCQEAAHPLDCEIRVPDHARPIGEDEQFAKMNHGSAGFEAADHSKVILQTV
jgi:hypothetical protein